MSTIASSDYADTISLTYSDYDFGNVSEMNDELSLFYSSVDSDFTEVESVNTDTEIDSNADEWRTNASHISELTEYINRLNQIHVSQNSHSQWISQWNSASSFYNSV
eukprot:NODE_602_length_5512_cov_0.250693.p4 type:complete len:107 gc:universal NODE_602_length_5512_cov_0.250693:2101-2421(+)